MKLHLWAAAALLFLCLSGCTQTPADGWVTTEKGTFYRRDGAFLEGWQEIDGSRYYFNEESRQAGETFAMVTGWMDLNDQVFYLGTDGVAVTGRVTIDGSDYFFDKNGVLRTGWLELDGKLCYIKADGSMATGWLDDGMARYYLREDGTPLTGWQELSGKQYCFREDGSMVSGWLEEEGRRFYFGIDGSLAKGMLFVEGKGYYFREDGTPHTGWLTLDERTYYFDSQGVMAVGPVEIDGVTHYFSPRGVKILLVNPWNYLPENYDPELVYITNRDRMEASCADALNRMLSDCAAAGHSTTIASGYRTQADQEWLFQRKVNYYLDLGYSQSNAKTEAAKTIAIPGTSEHQLGLAVDISDVSYPYLDDAQADTPAQQWLMAHCHEYGFILRYPKDTTHITGIIYEPWHYRYVGVDIATEIMEKGITLEEYLGAVPNS